MTTKSKNLKVINTLRYGCGEIEITAKYIDINYRGNMGSTEADEVAGFVDKLLGDGVFATLRPHGEFYIDSQGNVHRDASYSYLLRVPIEFAGPYVNSPAAKLSHKAIAAMKAKAAALKKREKIKELKLEAAAQLKKYHSTMAEIKRLSPPKKPATFEDYHEAGRDSEPTPSGGMGADR